jgi:hypothetical protein
MVTVSCVQLTMSSAFVPLTCLDTLVLSITDAHCPSQALVVKTLANGKACTSSPSSALNSPSHRRMSDARPELHTASTNASLPHSEPDHGTCSPRASLRRTSISSASASLQALTMNGNDIVQASVQGITGNVGSFDTSIPPKRDIRKFARRCPSLKVIRWTGRQGKGEWRIAVGQSSIHASIEFVPIHLVEDEQAEEITLGSGADVEDFILKKKKANMNYPGKQMTAEELDGNLASGLVSPFDDPQSAGTQQGGSEVTPRIDGRMFPRLKVASPTKQFTIDPLLNECKLATAGVDGDGDKRCQGAKLSAEGEKASKSKPTLTFGQVTRESNATKVSSKMKSPKSYAAISDPSLKGKVIEVESKLPVLGESNGRKGSNGQVGSASVAGLQEMSHQPPSSTSSSSKGRTVTKVRGPDDGYTGATIIIGQGKSSMSTTSGAAGRRTRKKLASQAKADEEARALSATTLAPASTKRVLQGRLH